jgi:hypothetical protein
VLGIIESELLWWNRQRQYDWTEILKVLIFVFTVMAIAGLREYAVKEIALMRARGDFIPHQASFLEQLQRAGLRERFLLTVLVLLVSPLPGVDVPVSIWTQKLLSATQYTSDELLVVAMLLVRLPIFLKCWALNDPLYEPSKDVFAKQASVRLSTRLVFAARVKYELSCIVALWVVSIGLLAYCLMVMERAAEGEVQLGSYHDAVWLTIITMTTVGYGDQYPITLGGGFFAVLSCFLAMVLLALTVNIVVWRLALDQSAQKVVGFADALSEHTRLRAGAARCIERLYLLSPMYRRLHPDAGSQGAHGVDAPRLLRKRWAALDRCIPPAAPPHAAAPRRRAPSLSAARGRAGYGPLGDAELVSSLRAFRAARRDQGARAARWRGDMQNQLCEAEDRAAEVRAALRLAEARRGGGALPCARTRPPCQRALNRFLCATCLGAGRRCCGRAA